MCLSSQNFHSDPLPKAYLSNKSNEKLIYFGYLLGVHLSDVHDPI